jgi:hypothetical protein
MFGEGWSLEDRLTASTVIAVLVDVVLLVCAIDLEGK